MEALKILQSKLIGTFYSRFTSGDSYEFRLDNDLWLIANNVISKDESTFNKFLEQNYQSYNKAIDQNLIAKNISITALMRQKIIDVALDKDCALIIKFENEEELRLATDTQIVDWHWALKKTLADPYKEFIVACFNANEVEVPDSWLIRLSKALNLNESFDQDWGICNADANRAFEFIEFFESHTVIDSWEYEELAELIFESVNDLIIDGRFTLADKSKLMQFIGAHKSKFPDVIDYWSRLDTDGFPVSKNIIEYLKYEK